MEVTNANGGNAEVAHTKSNLQGVVETNLKIGVTLDQGKLKGNKKMDGEEVNSGDKSVKKKPMKRKMRKSKSNSTSSVETNAKQKARGVKRKLSDPCSSNDEESQEFLGFSPESVNLIETELQVIQKLIADAELETNSSKRKRSSSKATPTNLESKSIVEHAEKVTITDGKTNSINVDEGLKQEDEKETEKKDAIVIPHASKSVSNNVNSETPSSEIPSVNASNNLYKEPFKFGWRREVIYKGESNSAQKRIADIYYYSPKGKKVKSLREVAECLTTKELTLDNFTFSKESIGVEDPSLEMITDTKKPRLESTNIQATPTKKSSNKRAPMAKALLTSPPGSPKIAKTSPPKATTPARFKIKVPGKRAMQKKEVKPSKESEMVPPQWASPTATRRSQTVADKLTSPKNKRILKAKLQEPCSIRCSLSMGLIPSLQCRICLCLYHPDCVGGKKLSTNKEYVCKNCQMELEPSERPQQSPSITPPALIPISMLGAHTMKSKFLPSKAQHLSKADTEAPLKDKLPVSNTTGVPSAIDKMDTPFSSWFPPPGKEFLPSHDGYKPKPAQNIAKMGEKRYIVIPKNNDMAVQPAIPIRPDRSFESERELLRDNALIKQNSNNESRRFSQLSEKLVQDKENTVNNEEPVAMDIGESLSDSMTRDKSISSNEIKDSEVGVEPAVQTMEVHMDVEAVELDKNLEIEPFDGSHTAEVEPQLETQINEMELKSTGDRGEALESNQHIDADIMTSAVAHEEKKEDIENLNTKCDSSTKKKNPPVEADTKQHFMVSVCAGYHALSRIFQYLTVQELLRAARVCRMWRDLAAHPALWKTVRMKNSPVTDWVGLAASLKRHGTQHLDLRKMLIADEPDTVWEQFVSVLPTVPSLTSIKLCKCPSSVVEGIFTSCPQLEILSAMGIKNDVINIESLGTLKHLKEVRLKSINGMTIHKELLPLEDLKHLTQLNLTSVKELGKKNIEVLGTLHNLQSLELGECFDFPDKFGTDVLLKLTNLEKLRLEKGQGTCCTFQMLEGVSKLKKLHQLELVNFDLKTGFDKCLASCKNIKRLLIIPTYVSQSATSNNMVLSGVSELHNNLTHFVWGVTHELLRVTDLFVDQGNQMNRQASGDSIPVLKPVPCLKLIEDTKEEQGASKDDKQSTLTNSQVEILSLLQVQKLLLTALPKTRVKILKIPFHTTWSQSISDTTSQ